MDRTTPTFEEYAAARLRQDSEQITLDWVERLSSQLMIAPERVLPHPELLDDIPLVLEKAAEFLLVPEPEKLTAEALVTEEMRNIALLRHRQGWAMQEVVREFDELAHLLDQWALSWLDDYPGTPDAKSVGRTFGRLNRVPLLMGQIMVGTLESERLTLLQQLAGAEEEERIRISRELHDQLGQLLTTIHLGLKALNRGAATGDQTQAIEELERLAEQTAREIQQLALDLRPPALDNLGLRLAMQNAVSDWSDRTGIECDFHSTGLDGKRFSREVETALYRVLQEGLNNVLKHAGATRVSVIVERRQDTLRLVLEDDGIGFEVDRTLASPEKTRRLGLRGMRERIAWLGGTIEIESTPEKGTTVFVRVPTGGQDAGEQEDPVPT